MRRHAFDPLSFIFGVVFLLLSGAFLVNDLILDTDILKWVAAGLLLFIGLVMLMTTRSSDRPET